MDDGASQVIFVAGTIFPIVAGLGHVVLTLVDVWRPTFFRPPESALISSLVEADLSFRARFPGRRKPRHSMWRAWLGFNLSHGLGVMTFGLVLLVLALDDYDLVRRLDLIQALSIVVPTTYFAVALRFWFWLPALGTGFTAACFAVAPLA